MKAADNALELAKVLAGEGEISNQDFLERMARSDELVDHDGTTCGQCHYRNQQMSVGSVNRSLTMAARTTI